jgi:hypothetical protein
MMRARFALWSAGSLAVGLALAGCNRHPAGTGQAAVNAATLPPLPASLPLSSMPPRGPLVRAPSFRELPRARPLDYGYVPGGEDYAWIDRADMLYDTIGDAPPDYGFEYDGVEPWAWETAGGYQVFAEPVYGGYRYYYYEPEADSPFLVRDPYYSYGYGDGRLVAVYRGGRPLGRAEAILQADAAARYFARARALRGADHDVDRRPVEAISWARQRPAFVQARREWTQARERDPAWRQWRDREPAGPALRNLQAEQQVRAAAAQRFDQWQHQGLRGPAPRLYPASLVRRPIATAPRPQAQARMAPMPRPRATFAAQGGRQADFGRSGPQALAPARAVDGRGVRASVPEQARGQAIQARSRQSQLREQARAQQAAGRAEAQDAARAEHVQAGHAARAARAAQVQRAAPAERFVQARQARAAEAGIRQQQRNADVQMRQQARAAGVQARAQAGAAQAQVRQEARMQVRQQAAARVETRAAPAPRAAAPRPQPAPRAAPAQPQQQRGGGHDRDHGH